MAINKKLIHFKNKQTFEQEVANENILDTSIVFIQDSKEISTHGTMYKTVNWSVLEPVPGPESKPLTFEALENGTFSFTKNGTGDDIQYSKDNGTTWTSLASGETVSVVTGDKVMWKSNIIPVTSYGIGTFSSSNNFNVSGNTMSLLYGDDFEEQINIEGKDYVFYNLFKNNGGLSDASNLILPATTLSSYCYRNMFQDCTNLTTAPELPATTLAPSCYEYMFQDCTSLNNITMLATDISANYCLRYWVNGVSSTGTFIKHPNMESLPTGISGIPEGWTVRDAVIS